MSAMELGRSYGVLLLRLRAAANGSKVPEEVALAGKGWAKASTCTVRPCWCFGVVMRIVSNCIGGAPHFVVRTAALVSSFLDSLLGEAQPDLGSVTVRADSLFPVQLGVVTRRRKRVLHDQRLLYPGSILAMATNLKMAHRKLVLVEAVQYTSNLQAVSCSLDQFPFFGQGEAWHAARVHHHTRLLDPPEAPCEHVGSLLHAAWNPAQGLAPRPLIDQALLKPLVVVFETFLKGAIADRADSHASGTFSIG